ncbi:hypothetical protein CapIbe_020988 [Capra ibex]
MGTIPPPPETKREPLPARGSRQEKAPNGTSWRGSRRRASRDPTSGFLLTSPPRTPPQGGTRDSGSRPPLAQETSGSGGGSKSRRPRVRAWLGSRRRVPAHVRGCGSEWGCWGQPPEPPPPPRRLATNGPAPPGQKGRCRRRYLRSVRPAGASQAPARRPRAARPAWGCRGDTGTPKPALLSPRPQTARGSAPWVAVPGRPVPASQRRATAGAEGQSPRRSPSAVPRSARPAPPPAAPPGLNPGVGGRGCGGTPRALGASLRRSAGRRARRGLLTPGPRRSRRRRRRARASRGSSAALWRSLALVPALTPTSAAGRPQPRPAEAPGRVPVSVAPRGAQSRPRLKPPRRPPED